MKGPLKLNLLKFQARTWGIISEEDVLELDLPSPYFHSNIVNQPLWLASTKFGRDEIIDLYLKVISNTASVKSYSDFAQRILNQSKSKKLTFNFSFELWDFVLKYVCQLIDVDVC